MVTQLGRAEPVQAQVWWLPAGLSAHPTLPLKAPPGWRRGAQESRGWPAPQWSPRPCTRCCSAHHSLLVPCPLPLPCPLALHKASQGSRPGSLVLRTEGEALFTHIQACAHTQARACNRVHTWVGTCTRMHTHTHLLPDSGVRHLYCLG